MASALFKVRAQAKGIELSCELKEEKGQFEWILGDSKLLRQVLINLIGNAIKFTDQGGVILRVRNLGRSGKNRDENKLRFCIEDTGPGIEKSYLEQVFEEFYQMEAFSGHKGGTGLGLAISRKLVSCMGGELEVDSEVGKGSRFWFELSTTLVGQSEQEYAKHLRTEHIRVKGANAHYLQLFSGELDSGVMRRMFSDLGFQTSLIEELTLNLLKPVLKDEPVIVVAITSDCLWSEQVNGIQLLLEQKLGDQLFWIVCMSGQKRDKLRVEEILKGNRYSCVEFPVNPGVLLDDIYTSNPDLWETDNIQAEALTESELIQEIPSLDVLNAMVFDARIGDMRAFNDKLSQWENSVKGNTVFAHDVSGMVESFRIDELCNYLNERIQSNQKEL